MIGALATVESVAGTRLSEIGAQLAMLGAVALFVGGVCLRLAGATAARTILMAGLLLFALGLSVRSLEHLGAFQLNYYPGWKADLEETFLETDPHLEFSNEDLEVDFGEPAWWEGIAWWGQRAARLLGLGLAVTGFFLDGRWMLQQGGPKRRRAAR